MCRSEVPQAPAEPHEQEEWCLSCLGYFYDAAGAVIRSVTFYCSDDRKQQQAIGKLQKEFPDDDVHTSPDDRPHCVVIDGAGGASKDFAWFEAVFQAAVS